MPLLIGLVLIGISSLAIFYSLGDRVLRTWDEAIYAEIAQEMLTRHTWLTPHWNFQPWFEKPPLFMWITAFFYQVFGVSELSARLFGALCGVATVWLTFEIARRLMDKWSGFIAAAILLTNSYFIFTSRYGAIDLPITFFFTIVAYAYVRVREGERHWWYVAGAATGLLAMLKGAGGLLAPLSLCLALVLDHQSSDFCSREVRNSVLLACGIALPWHVTMTILHGRAFVEEYIGYHVIARMKGVEQHFAPTYFTVWTYWATFLVFSLIALVGLVLQFKRQSRFGIVVSCVVVVTLCFSVVGTKLMAYSVPAYPFVSLLAATAIHRLRRVKYAAGICLAFLFPLHLVLTLQSPRLNQLLGISYGHTLGWVGSINSREEPLMRLLMLARSDHSIPNSQPLIIDLEGYTIQKQQSAFYAKRPILQASVNALPKDSGMSRYEDFISLEKAVNSTPAPIIIRRDTYQELVISQRYELTPVAEAGPLILAYINRH